MKQLLALFVFLLCAYACAVEPAAQALWYLRTVSGQMHPAWFETGARGVELRINDASVVRAIPVRFDDGGFVELTGAGSGPRWQLDGLSWRDGDGRWLIPAWVVPAGRGPGH